MKKPKMEEGKNVENWKWPDNQKSKKLMSHAKMSKIKFGQVKGVLEVIIIKI